MKGLVQHGTNPGPKTVLSAEEEEALVQYLVYMAKRGFPLTRKMVMAYAWAIAKRAGSADRFNPEYGPGKHWWSNFRKGHPELTLRKSDKLDRCRAEAYSAEVVGEYVLENVLKENNLINAPRQLYNCDETLFSSPRYNKGKGCNPQKHKAYLLPGPRYIRSYHHAL